MDAIRTSQLRWGAIAAGAVVAIGIGWMGDLLGGLISMIEPGESSAWAFIGGLFSLAVLVTGAFVGGLLCVRAAGVESRQQALIHSLVVWGLLATVGAFFFALLGGNVALLSGATPGAVRLALGFGTFALLIALGGAVLGGYAGTRRGMKELGRRGTVFRRAAEERLGRTEQEPLPIDRGASYPSSGSSTRAEDAPSIPSDSPEHKPPPSVH